MVTTLKSLQADTFTKAEIGMGASLGYGSDSYPFTVISISKSGKKAVIQQDTAVCVTKATLTSDPEYTYEPNPNGKIDTIRVVGGRHWQIPGGTIVRMGKRRFYQDPSF